MTAALQARDMTRGDHLYLLHSSTPLHAAWHRPAAWQALQGALHVGFTARPRKADLPAALAHCRSRAAAALLRLRGASADEEDARRLAAVMDSILSSPLSETLAFSYGASLALAPH